MRRNTITLRGPAVLVALVVMFISCNINRATADDPELEPARSVSLPSSSATAIYLREKFKPAQPLSRTSAGESVLLMVFDKDPLEVFSAQMPPGCQDDGVSFPP